MLNINGTTLCGMKDTLVIPEGIESIVSFAFRECQWIKHVQFPTSLYFIHACAFYHCTSLEDVILPKALHIDDYAFCGCTSLKRVIIPEGVEKIGAFAFAGCHALEEIHIPSSVEKISHDAFKDCVSLKKITVAPDNNNYSSDGIALLTKDKTRLKTLPAGCDAYTIPNTVTTIGMHACDGCVKIKEIVIPDSVTSMDYNAFAGCVSLKHVTISRGVKSIVCGTFKNCLSLVDVHIPENIENIEKSAFEGCASLLEITIPDSVHTIGDDVFRGCSMLHDVTLSNRLDTINCNVFMDCISLEKIDLKNVNTIHSGAFDGCCNLKEVVMSCIELGGEIDEPFHGCTSLTEKGITAPKDVAKEIIEGIRRNKSKSIIDVLFSPLTISQGKIEEEKKELIKGIWKDYLK